MAQYSSDSPPWSRCLGTEPDIPSGHDGMPKNLNARVIARSREMERRRRAQSAATRNARTVPNQLGEKLPADPEQPLAPVCGMDSYQREVHPFPSIRRSSTTCCTPRLAVERLTPGFPPLRPVLRRRLVVRRAIPPERVNRYLLPRARKCLQ
jgi:hypothetical protein